MNADFMFAKATIQIELWAAHIIMSVLDNAPPGATRHVPTLSDAVQCLRDRLEQDRRTIAEAREAQRVAEARLLALQNQQPAPAPVTLPDPVVGMHVRYKGREVEVMLAGPRFVAFTDHTWCPREAWTPDRVKFITDSDAEFTDDPNSGPLS